jgi:hypothetical protein
MASSKRQTTFAKMQREQRVKEKRALKLEKKQAAREAKAAGTTLPTDVEQDEAEQQPTDSADEVEGAASDA